MVTDDCPLSHQHHRLFAGCVALRDHILVLNSRSRFGDRSQLKTSNTFTFRSALNKAIIG
jgi:hypothetical protein